MPLKIVRNDITKMELDAIVSATDPALSGSGGADGSIQRAAGHRFLLKRLGALRPGEAKITRAGGLPCKYLIYTVGPVWQGGDRGEAELLASCYRKCLELAKRKGCKSLAFPLISSGSFGCPKDLALHTAVSAISSFLLNSEMEVYLVVYDRQAYRLSSKLFADIKSYIDDNYVQEQSALWARRGLPMNRAMPAAERGLESQELSGEPEDLAPLMASRGPSLEELLGRLDESFSQMLLRKIDEAGMSDAQCYKKANIDRKLFSKIRSDINYRPSKPTAIALAVALELPLPEMKELLEKAGFALSHSSKFDIVVEYFVSRGNYNIFEINEALFAFDQRLLGG